MGLMAAKSEEGGSFGGCIGEEWQRSAKFPRSLQLLQKAREELHRDKLHADRLDEERCEVGLDGKPRREVPRVEEENCIN